MKLKQVLINQVFRQKLMKDKEIISDYLSKGGGKKRGKHKERERDEKKWEIQREMMAKRIKQGEGVTKKREK